MGILSKDALSLVGSRWNARESGTELEPSLPVDDKIKATCVVFVKGTSVFLNNLTTKINLMRFAALGC